MRLTFIIGVVLLVLLAIPGVVVFGADVLGYQSVNTFLDEKFSIGHKLAISVPAAIALFCLLPMIVLLYFLRLKRQPVAVASTFLWKKSVEDLHVNRLMQWLRRNVLLLLQILAVLCLIYAVLGPRLNQMNTGTKHYIIMIDNSASMSATDVKPTRLDWAKEEALRIIDSHADSDTGMLIVFNRTSEVRQSYTNNREELRAAVRTITQTQFQTRIDEALSQAASLANPNRSTENDSVAPANQEPGKERTYIQNDGFAADVFLLSDGRFPRVTDFPLEKLNIRYPLMNSPYTDGFSDNIGIVRMTSERDGEDRTKLIVMVTVKNFRSKPTDLSIQLDVMNPNETEKSSYQKSVKIGPLVMTQDPIQTSSGQATVSVPGEVTVDFPLIGIPEEADLTLRAKLIHSGDIFPMDDTAWDIIQIGRKAQVMVVTPGNKYLRMHFDSKDAQKRASFTYLTPDELNNPREYLTPVRDRKFDIVIFDRCAPASEDQMPNANTYFIGHPPPPYRPASAGGEKAVKMVANPIVLARRNDHPLMKQVSVLDSIRIAEAYRLPTLPPRAPRLMEADADHVLIAAFTRQDYTDVVQTFTFVEADEKGPDTIHNCTWQLQPSFVLFLENIVKHLGGVNESRSEGLLHPGDIVTLRTGSAKEVQIRKPGSLTSITLERGTRQNILFAETDTLGVYRADWGGSRRFAVNLMDEDESNLSVVTSFRIGDSKEIEAGASQNQPLDLWKYVVLAALAVVLMEWWIYNRRVQI